MKCGMVLAHQRIGTARRHFAYKTLTDIFGGREGEEIYLVLYFGSRDIFAGDPVSKYTRISLDSVKF